jgi:hypothetical protein
MWDDILISQVSLRNFNRTNCDLNWAYSRCLTLSSEHSHGHFSTPRISVDYGGDVE